MGYIQALFFSIPHSGTAKMIDPPGVN